MPEKYWTFILNLDILDITIVEGDKEPAQVWPLRRVCRLYCDYFAMHRWFMETIDTPFLNMDSTYEVILDHKMTILETWREFIEFCDLVYGQVMF